MAKDLYGRLKGSIQKLDVYLVLLLATLFDLLKLSPDPDTFWHLATGRWILAHGKIPRLDPFNPYSPRIWMDHEWLSQTIFAFVYQAGYFFLVGLVLFIYALTLAVLYRLLRKKGLKKEKALLFLFITSITSAEFIQIRPQIFTYLLSLLLVYLMETWDDHKIRKYIDVSIIMVLWVNLHGGGTSFGQVIITGYLVSALFEKNYRKARQFFTALSLSIGAEVLNPYGLVMLLYPYKVMLNADLHRYIMEWQSPNFHDNKGLLLYVAGLFAFIIFTREKLRIKDGLFTLGLIIMSLTAARHFALLFLLAPVYLMNLSQSWPRYNYLRITRISSAAGLVVLVGLMAFKGLAPQNVLAVESPFYPVKAYKYLEQNHIQGQIYNNYGFGGSLLYYFEGRIQPSSDGRTDMYTGIYNPIDYFHKEMEALYSNHPVPGMFFDTNERPLALVQAKSWLNAWFAENKAYEQVYADDTAAIYKKK